MTRIPGFSVLCVVIIIITICFGTSVAVDRALQSSRHYGVILSESVIARQGDGNNYPTSFKESGSETPRPLHEGTEFVIIEQRPGWFHIRLADGVDTWIPENSAEPI